MTGISLLVIVYYANGAAFLIDVNVYPLAPVVAIVASRARCSSAGSTGVLIGTIMTGNVWLCIVPSQRALIAATEAGRPQDPVLSLRAKQRSIHNNYLTFPLLFMMLSNHFPSTYGHYLNWLVPIAVMAGGAGVRHVMNLRYRGEGRQMIPLAWLTPAAIMAAIAIAGLLVITRIPAGPEVDVTCAVGFARAQDIIVKRCVPCHSSHPTDPAFPAPSNNVVFETADQIKLMVPRIRERAVESKTMPVPQQDPDHTAGAPSSANRSPTARTCSSGAAPHDERCWRGALVTRRSGRRIEESPGPT